MKKYLAEVVGTFALVFAGCGAIIVNDLTGGGVSHVGVSLTFGLVVMAMVYAVGDVSGAHLNPAVTVGFWAARRLPGREVAPYIAGQLAGALVAGGCLLALFPSHGNLGATLPVEGWAQAFLIEVLLTGILMFVILCVSTGAKEKGIMAGAAVGATVALAALMGGPISGASMNPARSIAPALLSLNLQFLWVYLTAPLLGATLAVLACHSVQPAGCCSGQCGAPAGKADA